MGEFNYRSALDFKIRRHCRRKDIYNRMEYNMILRIKIKSIKSEI